MDDLLVFNLLRYILLFLIVYCGSISINTHAYWKFNIYPLILFAVMEGCRWKRGVDYMYNYRISVGIDKSYDLVYDSFAEFLYNSGFPFYIFFIIVSFLLIFAIYILVKPLAHAIVPCVIFLYNFCLIDAENLMRQYCALSLFVIAFYIYFYKTKIFALLILIVAFNIHKSVLFPVMVSIVFLLLKKMDSKQNVISNLPKIFVFLFFISSVLSSYFSDILQILYALIPVGSSDKYISADYVRLAIDDSSDYFASSKLSIVTTIRHYWTVLSVMLIGFISLNKIKEVKLQNYLLIIYCLGCFGMVYDASLPKLSMEVIQRLGIYLSFFFYLMEGYMYYDVLKRNKTYYLSSVKGKWIYYSILALLIFNLAWVVRPFNGTEFVVKGVYFIWS